jgi:hypothetical protein
VDFPKERRSKDGGLYKTKERHNQRWRTFNERDKGKTQPKWRTFTHEKKDTTKVGGLSEGKTQPRWRTFTHEKKDATKDGGLSTKTKGATQPTMADLTTKNEARNVFEVCFTEEERRSQYGGLSICEGYYHKLY